MLNDNTDIMKNYILLLLCVFLFSSCFDEDERGQYSIENVPPGKVESPEVVNIPGGSIITYTIPDDEDLLYVKATYTLDNGEVMEQKASAYVNSLKIEGIGKSREVDVTLVAGDRSKNESEPITVQAFPLDAPIYTVFETLEVTPDFGGIRLKWDNPGEAEIVVTVSTPDEFGNMVAAENFYTKSKNGEGSVRGYSNDERLFGISLRDRWDNLTDTLKGDYTPLFEERIEPEDNFVRWNPVGIPYTQYSPAFAIETMWDDNPETRYLFHAATLPTSFTFDMGQTAIFSRFRVYMHPGQLYVGQSVESFELWGSPTADVNEDFSSGWVKLGEYRFTRPSEEGGTTQEDTALGLAGEDFSVDPSAPPVRYIRFVVTKNWGNGVYNTLGDIRFWGQVVD